MKFLAWYTIALFGYCFFAILTDIENTTGTTILGILLLLPVLILAIMYIVVKHKEDKVKREIPKPTVKCKQCLQANSLEAIYCSYCGTVLR